jgi:hypothetical protein
MEGLFAVQLRKIDIGSLLLLARRSSNPGATVEWHRHVKEHTVEAFHGDYSKKGAE